MKESKKKVNPKFVTKISKLWYLYLIMSLILFFNLINILIGGGFGGYILMYETVNSYNYIYPLILGILSIRYTFYIKLKSLISHTTFNDFDHEMDAQEVFLTFKNKPRVYKSNLIVSYFFSNVMRVLRINATDIFTKDNSFKKSFLRKIMSSSVAIREKMQELQSNRVKAVIQRERQRRENEQLQNLKKLMTEHKEIQKSMRDLNRLSSLGNVDTPTDSSKQKKDSSELNLASSLFQGEKGTGLASSIGNNDQKDDIELPEMQSIHSEEESNDDTVLSSEGNSILGTRSIKARLNSKAPVKKKKLIIKKILQMARVFYMKTFIWVSENFELIFRVIV